MITPAIMLLLLCGPAVLAALGNWLSGRQLVAAETAACVGICLMFGFTGVGHFVKTEPMADMLPPWVPGRVPLVLISGVVELTAAGAILIPSLRKSIGWGLIAMLVLFLPVNIYAAMNHTGMGGHQWGPVYLLIRIPLQLILIGWIWWFAVHGKLSRERTT